jgi:hypothetical protein
MRRLAMLILWPSFLVAALAEGLFFSLFDPAELPLDSLALPVSPLGAYTVGFFLFWVFCALAGMLTYYLACVPADRQPPF